MTTTTGAGTNRRRPLTRDRVLRAAVALADREGIAALTMRRLGEELGVRAMSLYKHVANKEEILDGLIEVVIGEIELPPAGTDWRTAMRRRAQSAREVMTRHPWAITVIHSRANPTPAALRYYDAVVGMLRRGGFSVAMASRAFALLDSYIYGFVVQETSLPFRSHAETEDVVGDIVRQMPTEEYPHLTEMAQQLIMREGYTFGGQFEFGLDLILDGLERFRDAA